MEKRIKTGGRKKGVPNRSLKHTFIKTFIGYILDNEEDKFSKEFNKLEGKEYLDVFLKMAALTSERDDISTNRFLVRLLDEKIKTKTI